MQEPNDRSHRVRRTVIDECGVISTACRLEAGGLRSMYPRASTEGSPFLIPATVLPRGDEHPVRKFVERSIVEATLAARWGIRRNLETYVEATSANRGHARGR